MAGESGRGGDEEWCKGVYICSLGSVLKERKIVYGGTLCHWSV